MSHRHGETVKLSLVSVDAFTAPVPIRVSDANGKDRPIQPWERLVIDMLDGVVVTAADPTTITDPGPDVDESLLGVISTEVGLMVVPAEGTNVSVGSTPLVTATAAGAVAIIGSGRIINGQSQGVRPFYRELLTAGGNIGGV